MLIFLFLSDVFANITSRAIADYANTLLVIFECLNGATVQQKEVIC